MRFKNLFAACIALGLIAGATHAQSDPAAKYPDKPITLIVPYAAGGGTDAIARTIARSLGEKWGQSIIVDNRTGADGLVGTQRALQHPNDGYTLLIQLNSMLLYEWLHKNAGFKPTRDLIPISKIQESPLTITVRADHPANTFKELIEHCKKTGTCAYGTATANGKLVGRQIEEIAQVKLQDVPYKGTSAVVNDLLGGHLEIGMLSANLAAPLHKEGKIKALTVGTDYRFTTMPDVPTFFEIMDQNINGTTWYGLFAKSGTPESIIKKIEKALMDVAKDEKIRALIVSQGATPLFTSTDHFTNSMNQEYDRVSVIADKVFQ